MTCPKCDRDFIDICECGYRPKYNPLTLQTKKPLWLIQSCTNPGCDTAIRVPIAQPLSNPICKWCDQGLSHATKPRQWPAGMPDPEFPWPWMTEADRERKLRMPYWKERLHRHGEIYQAWFRT